jgi:DNA-binding MarR family transcriptional regulator
MSEIQQVLESFPPKGLREELAPSNLETELNTPTFSEIPDLFFDNILAEYKLTRLDIQVLLYLYRQVWCLPNLHKKYGIGQLNNLKDLSELFKSDFNTLQNTLQKLESFDFISTIRLGQYFVRRFFTAEWDNYYAQNYDDFLD